MNEPPELPLGERLNRSMNLVVFIAGALAFPSVVFLHRDIGRRYAGAQALLSVVVIFFWPILDSTCNPMPMMYFLGAVLFMSFVSRMQGLRRKAKGDDVFRFYNGYPRLMRFFFCNNEVRFKRFQEPVIVFFVGCMVGIWSPLLAFFLMASAVGLAVTTSAIEIAANERAEAMRDQMIRQQELIERFRRLSGK